MPSVPWSPTWSLPLKFIDRAFACISHFRRACYMSCSFHPTWFVRTVNIWCDYKLWSCTPGPCNLCTVFYLNLFHFTFLVEIRSKAAMKCYSWVYLPVYHTNITHLLHIAEVSASSLGPETGYTDWGDSWFFSVPPENVGIVPEIRLRPLPSTSFRIYYSLITLLLDVI